ncbi:hypothetical protein [uncultured Clostridium sp.]|jgi:hypothetical protein|nr:hypothetical protein [uncultured Clostridium sp.]
MYIGKIEKTILEHLRGFVHCMHIDKYIDEKEVVEKGFKIASLVTEK